MDARPMLDAVRDGERASVSGGALPSPGLKGFPHGHAPLRVFDVGALGWNVFDRLQPLPLASPRRSAQRAHAKWFGNRHPARSAVQYYLLIDAKVESRWSPIRRSRGTMYFRIRTNHSGA